MRAFVENELMIKRFLRRYASSSHDIEDISQETITRALRAEQQKEILEPKAFLFASNAKAHRVLLISGSVIHLISERLCSLFMVPFSETPAVCFLYF